MPNPTPTPHRDPHNEVAMPWAMGFLVLGIVLVLTKKLAELLGEVYAIKVDDTTLGAKTKAGFFRKLGSLFGIF